MANDIPRTALLSCRHFGDGLWRATSVLDYLFGLLYNVARRIRLLLVMIEARQGTGFVRFIATLTDPFYAPFRGIVPSGAVDAHPVAWPIVIAIAAYMVPAPRCCERCWGS